MIVLLDLNYTLVANSEEKHHPFLRQVQREQYRQWLIGLIRGHTVLLITARPVQYRRPTLESLHAKTGWLPQEAFFNYLHLPPPAFKRRILTEHVLPRYGTDPAGYLAIESNPKTRAMYESFGIRAVAVGEKAWTELP